MIYYRLSGKIYNIKKLPKITKTSIYEQCIAVMGLFTVAGMVPVAYLTPKTMRPPTLLAILLCLLGSTTSAQTDPWLTLTIKVGTCHGAKPMQITVLARQSMLKKFIQKESLHFDNCSYLLESPDDILKAAAPAKEPAGAGRDGDPIWVKDPGEFVELYKIEKKSNQSTEIYVDSDSKVSFSIGAEKGKIEINSKGGFSISAKSPSGITHSAEL